MQKLRFVYNNFCKKTSHEIIPIWATQNILVKLYADTGRQCSASLFLSSTVMEIVEELALWMQISLVNEKKIENYQLQNIFYQKITGKISSSLSGGRFFNIYNDLQTQWTQLTRRHIQTYKSSWIQVFQIFRLFWILYRDPICIRECSHARRDSSSLPRLYSTVTPLGKKVIVQISTCYKENCITRR